MSKYQIKWPRHSSQIDRIDEETRVADLSPAAAAHEAPKLLLQGPALPCRLLLEGAEGSKVTLSVNYAFHSGCTESADQLVLEICNADEEPEPFQIGASEVGAEPSLLESPPEVALLSRVTETRQLDVKPLRAEHIQKPADGLGASNRHDGDALSIQISTTALGERLERDLVTDAFNEHDCTRVHATAGREELFGKPPVAVPGWLAVRDLRVGLHLVGGFLLDTRAVA